MTVKKLKKTKNLKEQRNDEVIRKSQLRFKGGCHDVYTEKINKIALSSNDDKKIQTFDKITTYPYGTSVFKVCEKKKR